MDRRDFMKSAAGLGVGCLAAEAPLPGQAPTAAKRTARLKQSVTRGVFGRGAVFEDTCKLAAELGFKGYDLIYPQDWPTLKKYGLISTMAYAAPANPTPAGAGRGAARGAPVQPPAAASPGARADAPSVAGQPPAQAVPGQTRGGPGRGGAPGGPPNRFNQPAGPNVANRTRPSLPSSMELNIRENHDEQEELISEAVDNCAANGVPNVIVFSGYHVAGGMSDQEAADNCVSILKRVKARAEDKGVNICLELLNSRVNHRGYIFDHMDWGVEVMTRVDSTRVGILYDIYHAAIDDGDVSRYIHNNIKWIKHFHTAGVPGRYQLDDDQELNYRYIAKVIAGLGFDGFIGHEYNPSAGADPTACLKQAFEIFNI